MHLVQEEVNQKAVTISVKATKLTGRLLAKVIAAALRKMRQARDAPHHGKQTVKQLARQNAGMQSIEITDDNIGSFEKYARKYGVDFALKRDNGSPPKWMVFFKARDADALTAAFTEFSRDTLKRVSRPSVREAMRSFRELIQHKVLDRSKVRERSGPDR
jgi:transposase